MKKLEIRLNGTIHGGDGESLGVDSKIGVNETIANDFLEGIQIEGNEDFHEFKVTKYDCELDNSLFDTIGETIEKHLGEDSTAEEIEEYKEESEGDFSGNSNYDKV